MLGDLIYETKGKVVGYRVLDSEDPRIEDIIVENGNLKGRIQNYRYNDLFAVFLGPEGHIMLKVKEFL